VTGDPTVSAADKGLLDDLVLDKEGQARASIALALAGKLDAAGLSQSGAVAVASSGLARELSATLDAIIATQTDSSDFVEELFGRSPS
jgi:hypothetical protein